MDNIYLPKKIVIKAIKDETSDVKSFTFAFKEAKDQASFSYEPGQFVELSVFGGGEAPFGMATSPTRKGYFIVSIRAVGKLTRMIHSLKAGDELGVRGPFGNHFPYEECKGKNVLFIGGGIGLCPLRSYIHYIMDKREEYGDVTILYGARTPSDMVYKEELAEWGKSKDMKCLLTVDTADKDWKGDVGVVGSLFKKITLDAPNTAAIVCGPPIMIKFVVQDLFKLGFKEENIITTLERYMKCGIGKCGHCAIGHKYVCIDGPVFNFKQIKSLPEKV